MTKDQIKIRDEAIVAFNKAFPEKSLFEIIRLVDDLRRLGKAADKNAENLCNITDYADKRHNIQSRVSQALALHGVSVEFKVGGDPRGYCLKIMLPDGNYNTWGGKDEGWGL